MQLTDVPELLTRDAVMTELVRFRDQAQQNGYTLTNEALEEIADFTLSHQHVKDPRPLGPLLAQWIKERAQPITRQPGRMLTSGQGMNRKARRAAAARSK